MNIAMPFWAWDGSTWHPLATTGGSPGGQPALVTQSDGTVLGYGNGGTWTYTGSGWQLRGYAPAALADPVGMALDPTSGRVIAVERYQPGFCMPHSGCSKPAYMRTFTWTGSRWKELTDQHTPFPFGGDGYGSQGPLVADPAGGGLLMQADNGSTWRRTPNGHWTQVATAAQSPPMLQGMTLVADPASHEVVGFGGSPLSSYQPSNTTWIWNGSRWRALTAPLGQAPIPPPPAPVDCDLNGPSLQGNQGATIGTTVQITGANLFVTSPCHLQATFTLTLVDSHGTPLAVVGNPATVNIDTHTTNDGSGAISLTWTWTHACADTPVTANIKATGEGAFPTPFPVDLASLPTCHGTESSTLHAGTYRLT